MWFLGEHRLLEGDCTNKEDLEKLIGSDKVKLIFTDPPYNVNINSKKRPYCKEDPRKLYNDNLKYNNFDNFLFKSIKNMTQFIIDGCIFYCFMGTRNFDILLNACKLNKIYHSDTIIWQKQHFIISRNDYHSKYEAIFYGWYKPKQKTRRVHTVKARNKTNIWNFKTEFKRNKYHPTPKPVMLIEEAILNSSNDGDYILDPFAGGGATLIAAEKTKRKALLLEIDPQYIKNIVERFINETGKIDEVFFVQNNKKIRYKDLENTI